MRITTLPTPATDISSLATASALATVDANVDSIKSTVTTNLDVPVSTAGKTMKCDVLTGSGTWTQPTGVEAAYVVLVGPGGGGAAGTYYNWTGTFYGAEGGGAGELFMGWIPITGNMAYVVGVGGAGGVKSNTNPSADGSYGTDTEFGSYVATSGVGGRGANSVALNPGADGGGTITNPFRAIGQSSPAGKSTSGTTLQGGDGAPSPITGGGGGTGSGGNVTPSKPTDPGAGGGAGYSQDNGGSSNVSNGGDGADGYIAVYYMA